MKKIVRVTTVPVSLGGLLKGQLKFMSQYFEVIGVSSESCEVGKKVTLNSIAEQEKIRVFPVEMTRKITPLQDLKSVYRLYKFFKEENPDIVHSHTPKAGTVAMLAAKLAGVPYRLHTIAGMPLLEASGAKRKLLNVVEKFTYSCCTKIYPNSKGQYKIIQDLGFTTVNKLKVLGKGSSNGIDTELFNPILFREDFRKKLKETLGFHKDDLIYIFIGRLVKDKGINELISAFTQISNQYNHAKLLLVGAQEKDLDPLEPKTIEQIEKHPSIKCTGWVNDVRPYLSISNILAFPSYREGFPNVVMQAGAMGLCSIVTDINGCNEIITNDFNGLIIPTKDTESLKKAMLRFISEKDLMKELSKNARKTICDNYERTFLWNAILEEYKYLLNS